MENTSAWLDRITGGLSHRRVAIDIGVTNTALSRWTRTETMTAPWAVEIARHYGADVVEALACTGHITEAEMTTTALGVNVKAISTVELSRELHHRIVEADVRATVAAENVA